MRCDLRTADEPLLRPDEVPFDCLAVKRGAAQAATGYPFRAVIDVPQGHITWCRDIPQEPGGEILALSSRCTGRR